MNEQTTTTQESPFGRFRIEQRKPNPRENEDMINLRVSQGFTLVAMGHEYLFFGDVAAWEKLGALVRPMLIPLDAGLPPAKVGGTMEVIRKADKDRMAAEAAAKAFQEGAAMTLDEKKAELAAAKIQDVPQHSGFTHDGCQPFSPTHDSDSSDFRKD